MAEFIVETKFLNKTKLHQILQRMKWLRLYVDDTHPDRNMPNYPPPYVEASSAGYAPVDVSGHSLGDPDLYDVDANGTAYRDIPTAEFLITADGSDQFVYGIYITDDPGNMLASQRGEGVFFPLPFYRAGDRIRVTLRITQESYGPPPPPAP